MRSQFQRYATLLTSYLRPQARRVAMLAVLLLSSIGLQLVNPQILRDFIDTATSNGSPETLMWLALMFIGVALLGQVLVVGVTYLSENVSWTATNALRADLAAHCLRLDLAFHKARTPGELIERIDGDVNELSNFFSQFVINFIGNMLLLLGVLVLLFREDWRIGIGLTVFTVAAMMVLLRLRNFATPYWDRAREQNAKFFGFIGEQLAGTEDARSSGATNYVMQRFYGLMQGWLPLQRRANLAGYSMWITTIGLFVVGNAVAFSLGALLWSQGLITIGTVYMIVYYTELLRQPIEQLRTQLQELQRADASMLRISRLFAIEPTIRDGAGRQLTDGPLAIDFEQVSFGYRDAPAEDATEPQPNTPVELVLDQISFAVAPGRVVGLLGRTGSGKTTIARLLARLYDPLSGEICLNGVALRDVAQADLRRRVGVVTQDVQLFNATVRDNLTFFDPAITDQQILVVLDDLGMRDWLASLPNGLDTELEAGSALSAGESQLLAFARLFLANPGLVILDEASSRLDPATEQLLERAIARLMRGRTGIIIAHHLATVQRADEIIILDQGQILERGQREQLVADPNSRFATLLRTGLEEVLA